MANRSCPECKKFVPKEADKCPHCKADLRSPVTALPGLEAAGFRVEPLPRYRFEIRFPTGEHVEAWVEGDEVDGLAIMLEQAAGELRKAHAQVAP